MIRTKIKRLTVKVVTLLLCFGVVIGLTALGISASVATSSTGAALYEANGSYTWGVPPVTDPSRVEMNEGSVYYEPTSYVYFGSYYDGAAGKTVQVLNRVLDADADSTGNADAMFLLTENGISAESFFFDWSYDGIANTVEYENVYTQSRVSVSDSMTISGISNVIFNSTEREFLRGITKTDSKAEMQDLFGGFVEGVDAYYIEADTVNNLPYELSGKEVVHSETAEYLNNSKYFLLSVKEIYDYLGTYHGAESIVATNGSGEEIAWWTRTGLGESYDTSNEGNHVIAVNEYGELVPVSVDDEAVYIRLGFNLKTDKIAYSQRVGTDTYRVAMEHPKYTADEFKAEIIKREDGPGDVSYVTLRYSGALGIKSTSTDKGYVTVIIEDVDGNIKYYGNIAEVASNDLESGVITDDVGEVTFALPSDYNEETDRIVVFWEQKNEDVNASSYISNRITFDCAHSAVYPSCVEKARCNDCGEEFGEVDPNAHGNNITTAYVSDGSGTHWIECKDCKARLIEVECTYENICTARCCICGSPRDIDEKLCQYDDNGICIYNNGHYESPIYIKEDYYTRVVIENVGNWLSFAKTVNSASVVYGESEYFVYSDRWPVYIELMNALDFTDYDFIPIGNSEHYITGYFSTLGKDLTVKGINYSSEDACVGLFGNAQDFDIMEKLTLTESSFSGASNVGAIVGYGVNVDISKVKVTNNVVVDADDGTEGAFIGKADGEEKSNISGGCVSIDVKNGDGVDLAFSSDGNVSVTKSFCLFAVDGEDGKASAQTFASGSVANELQGTDSGWSQIIDKLAVDESTGEEEPLTADPFPRYVPIGADGKRVETVYHVYTISDCDGKILKYTNNSTESYTVHKPSEVLDWIWDAQECKARVVCELCGAEDTVVAHVELDYTYVPVRGDYVATILDPDGNAYTDSEGNVFSDEITIIGIRIESMIGMTNIERIYDAVGVYPEELMDNHRLNDGTPYPAAKEYEVYFVNSETGKKYVETKYDYYGRPYEEAAPVYDVGVYDLLVIGKNDYEGQSYTFKSALTILSAVVEIEPHDVCKYYDGSGRFEPEYSLTESDASDYYGGLFSINYEEAASSAEGVYELKVSVTSKVDDSNVRFVLTRNTVQAVILPKLYVDVENRSYPTEFTYGDTVPVPDESYFDFTTGSSLSFEWYQADLERWEQEVDGVFVELYNVLSLSKIDGTPKNAGDYVLRVKASGIDQLAAAYCDIVVKIAPANTLDIVWNVENIPIYNDGYYDYYVLDMGEEITYNVVGLLNGDTIESAGISVYMNVQPAEGNSYATLPGGSSAFPTQPYNKNYRIYCSIHSNNGNYETIYSDSIYVMVKAQTAKPATASHLYDGQVKGVEVVFSWSAVDGADAYTVYVTDPAGNRSNGIVRTVGDNLTNDIRNGNIFATYKAMTAGDHTVEVYAGGELKESFTFTVVIADENGESLQQIVALGKYSITVIQNGVASEAEVFIKREVVMLVKECEYDLDSGAVVFDPTRIVMEAGKVIMLGHTLKDVYISVNADNGEIVVAGFKVVDENGKDVSYYYELNNVVYSWSHNKDEGNEAGRNVAHVFDSYCDGTCNVERCEYTRQRAHSGGTATCTDMALCDYCNSPYGEYSTENHVSEAIHVAPNGDDLETHLLIHSCCGQTSEVLEHTQGAVATCISRAVCEDCGWEYGEVDPENHASEDREYAYIDDQVHKITYICCGAEQAGEHSGAEADCQSRATCVFCDKKYGKIDPDNHNGHIEYVPDESDSERHVEKYNCCGTSASVAHSGGTQTCISLAVCQYCSEEYGSLNAHNHASENVVYTVRSDNGSMHDMNRECCKEYLGKEYHSGGEGNCISSAICRHCNAEYGSEMNAENHASAEFLYIAIDGESAHVKVHACCAAEIERAEHSGGEASCLHGRLCLYCEAEYTDAAEHTFANGCTSICSVCNQQARAESFHVDTNTDELCDVCQAKLPGKKLSGGAISSIATATTVASGTGAFSLVWFVIKKKSWSELLRLLIG